MEWKMNSLLAIQTRAVRTLIIALSTVVNSSSGPLAVFFGAGAQYVVYL